MYIKLHISVHRVEEGITLDEMEMTLMNKKEASLTLETCEDSRLILTQIFCE